MVSKWVRAGRGAQTDPVRLTAFQRRVFQVVKRIPKGEVRSYRWVARQLGNVGLARAVGQALKRNPRPVEVPCHRVIQSDGSLGGYAWGVLRKRRLLTEERLSGVRRVRPRAEKN